MQEHVLMECICIACYNERFRNRVSAELSVTIKNLSAARLLDEALAAEAAGRIALASELLERARIAECAVRLEGLPIVYWAEDNDLMMESRDGAGPCPVLTLLSGTLDMARLANRLNENRDEALVERAGLTEHTRFIVDCEYVSRDDPPVLLQGFAPGRSVAELLNSTIFAS
jgi:hypothetical protein